MGKNSKNSRRFIPVYVPPEDFLGKVLDIIYWRDIKRSGVALGLSLGLLYLSSQFTVLSMVSSIGLTVLFITITFRIFKLAESKIKHNNTLNPFEDYFIQDPILSVEKTQSKVDGFVNFVNSFYKQLLSLFLVENFIESIKFGLFLYTLTYIGDWFSGISLILIFILALFSVPKVFELYHEPINQYISIIQDQFENIQTIVENRIPFMKKETKKEN